MSSPAGYRVGGVCAPAPKGSGGGAAPGAGDRRAGLGSGTATWWLAARSGGGLLRLLVSRGCVVVPSGRARTGVATGVVLWPWTPDSYLLRRGVGSR